MSDTPFFLHKMHVKHSDPIEYALTIDGHECVLNEYLGQPISITFTGRCACIQCGRDTKKTFQQGYCYPCYRRLQECNMCMIHPERCRVMEGCCSKDDWAHKHCHAEQVIYLSYTSGLKVGITQIKNCPSRWIDQGAVAAVPVMRASNRFLCGQVEVALKEFVADKTQWRAMLRESPEAPDLLGLWEGLLEQAELPLVDLIDTYGEEDISVIDNPVLQTFEYPVVVYPKKITSLSLDKTPTVSGVLQGIKGQYIYLDTGVMNIRKFGGYEVTLES